MKKVRFYVAGLVISALAIALTGCDKETVMDINSEVPNEIKTYANTHFPNNEIIQVIKDLVGVKKTYDVLLMSNTTLEFNRKLNIIDIDSDAELPASVIPTKIQDYVMTHFPNNVITGWEIEDKHQQVGLDNDVELEFTMNGDFIRIDN